EDGIRDFHVTGVQTCALPILKINGLEKTYNSGSRQLTVLQNVSFEVEKGQTFSIVGPSGSGKTTLLGLCAGLDTPSAGTVELCRSEEAPCREMAPMLLGAGRW